MITDIHFKWLYDVRPWQGNLQLYLYFRVLLLCILVEWVSLYWTLWPKYHKLCNVYCFEVTLRFLLYVCRELNLNCFGDGFKSLVFIFSIFTHSEEDIPLKLDILEICYREKHEWSILKTRIFLILFIIKFRSSIEFSSLNLLEIRWRRKYVACCTN